MKQKKLLAGVLCLGLLAAPSTALADSTDVSLIVNDAYVGENAQAQGAQGFFAQIAGDKTATAAQRKDAQNALDTLLGKRNKPSWYDSLVHLDPQDPKNPASLHKLEQSLSYMQAINDYRTSVGLEAWDVNLEMVAQSIVNTFYSADMLNHSGAYDGFENIAWGNYGDAAYTGGATPETMTGAMWQWITMEKQIWDEAIASGSFNGQPVDVNFLEQNKHDVYQIAMQGGVYSALCGLTGHYLNFINTNVGAMGFAFGNISNSYGSIALWRGIWSGSMTLDDYAERVRAASGDAGQVYVSDAGRTMIPLRLVSETMDYTTTWQPDGSIHIASPDGKVDVTLKVGSRNYTANGKAGIFETMPTLKNDRTYLPARDFTELYGDIYWDNATRTVWVAQGEGLQYRVIGDKLLRADSQGIKQLALPVGITVMGSASTDPIRSHYSKDGDNFIVLETRTGDAQLFRDDGDHLTYLKDVD